APPADTEEAVSRDWGTIATEMAWFVPPGLLIGGLVGWFCIRPVNRALGWFFRRFNRVFDQTTELYGVAVGRTLRVRAIILLGYAGLLALTYFQFVSTPTGFIPQQDKGYLILNVQLPDSASVERTEAAMARIDDILSGPRDPKTGKRDKSRAVQGVKHTLGISGRSLILNANAPN